MSPSETKNTRKRGTPESDDTDVKPKRPLTAYFRFSVEKRPEIRDKNPDMKLTDTSKVISQMWKDMSDAEKAVYEEAFQKEWKEWREKMAEWKAAHPNEKKEKRVKKEKKAGRRGAKKVVKEESEESEDSEESDVEEATPSESEEEEEAGTEESE